VLVGGGDGTMAHAVDALAHRDTVLGVLPLGTGNSFARSLAIPLDDLDAAVDVVAQNHVERIDLGCANGTHFANFATVGLSSIVAGDTGERAKGLFGRLAYAFAALRPLATHRGFRARIAWPAGELDLVTQDIVVGNGRYFGASPIAADAGITDGRFTLFVAEGRSAFAALRTWLAFGLRAQTALPDAHVVSAKRLTIRTSPKQRIAIDGSLFERTPARLHVASRALRAFVP